MCQPNSNGDRIVIRLAVEIPAGTAAPQITAPVAHVEGVKGPVDTEKQPGRIRILSFRAECRVPYSNSVLFSGSGTAPAIGNYGRPKTAHAVVVHESVSPDPTTIDPAAVSVPVNPDTGFWEFVGAKRVRVDNVCNHVDPKFKMFVWLRYQNPYLSPPEKLLAEESTTVTVDCSTLPQCAAGIAKSEKHSPKSAAITIEKLAYRWVADVEGFVGRPVKAFNGKWLLKVSGQHDGTTLVIDNAEEKEPVAVSLRLNLEAGAGELLLRHKDTSATYFLAEGVFRGDAENTFRFADLEGVDGNCSIPMAVRLAPA
jgi:hypothetical protein